MIFEYSYARKNVLLVATLKSWVLRETEKGSYSLLLRRNPLKFKDFIATRHFESKRNEWVQTGLDELSSATWGILVPVHVLSSLSVRDDNVYCEYYCSLPVLFLALSICLCPLLGDKIKATHVLFHYGCSWILSTGQMSIIASLIKLTFFACM